MAGINPKNLKTDKGLIRTFPHTASLPSQGALLSAQHKTPLLRVDLHHTNL